MTPMPNHNADKLPSCAHCGDKVRRVNVNIEQAAGNAFECKSCGCCWNAKMVLTQKGHSCPVLGREAMRSTVLRLAKWLVDQGDAQPTPTPL
jgi:hypothetical protein